MPNYHPFMYYAAHVVLNGAPPAMPAPKEPSRRAKRAKKVKMGRPKGSVNASPRPKRTLTPVQKLREHVLIELGVDKKEIAAAIGETRQTVSNVFFDVHRSDAEAKVVAFLRERYIESDIDARYAVDHIIERAAGESLSTGGRECPTLTLETLGWSRRSSPTPVAEPVFAFASRTCAECMGVGFHLPGCSGYNAETKRRSDALDAAEHPLVADGRAFTDGEGFTTEL